MGVKVIRIYELDGVVNARLELVGSFFEVEVPAGPVAGGYINKRLGFEQFAALLGSNTIGGAPQWVQGASYKEGQLVYNKGRTFRVQEDIANPQAEPLATNRYYRDLTYDDTSIYALARAIRDRVDALDRNVIRWNLPRRVTLVSGGSNPSYESGDAFEVYASTTSANGNLFTLAAPDYPRQGDYLGILVRADSLPIILKGLRFGSPTGPTTVTLPAGYQYEVHAATDTPGDITATYWVVHSSPSSGPTTAPTAVPFGPLTATGAAGETFPLPAGTQSVRGVQVFDVSPGPGQYPVVGLTSNMYTLDTSAVPPTLSVLAPYTLSVNDTIEGIALTVASAGGGGTPAPGKPKKLVFIGDSLVNEVLTTTPRAMARLNSGALASAIVSFPGEGARDFLNNHLAASAAEVDSTKDCYALVSEDTNGLNQYYIDQVKADALELANALLAQGYKGIVWMQVAACQSPYAYARDANGNIIGTSTADRQAGFDTARKSYNNYLQALVGSKLNAMGNLSIYPNVYTQSSASDARYFYPAATGPYGASEPGKVHYTDYGAQYWAEAAAQAAAPMLGITLNPATVTIPDAPTGYLSSPQTVAFTPSNANTAYVGGIFTKVAGGYAWNAGGLGNIKADLAKLKIGEKVVLQFGAVGTGGGAVYGGTNQYQEKPTDLTKGDFCYYSDQPTYDVWQNGRQLPAARNRRAGEPFEPRIEFERQQGNDLLSYYYNSTTTIPEFSQPGNFTDMLFLVAYLFSDGSGADGASTITSLTISGPVLLSV